MGIFDGCLLACDIDGTLMENGYINPENVEKVAFFESQGGRFVISTGRGVAALTTVLEQMKDISIAVVANGCIIYNYKNGDILYEKNIKKEEFHFADFICNSGVDVGVEVHCGANAYTVKRNHIATIHQEYEKFEAPDVTVDEISNKIWNKVIFTFETAQEREKVKQILAKKESESVFLDTCAVINGEVQNYLEQVPKGVSKANALKELCKILEIKKGGLFAIGDYYNDIEMLQLGDISAAPCGSPEEIKQIADHITCSCQDGAVADFINYLTSKFNA